MRIGDRPLKDLSDRELEEELQRRRRARGYTPGRAAASTRRKGRRAGPPGWRLRKWFRALELEPGASREEVERAYARLRERYHPDRQTDPEKRRLATRLMGALREAYRGIQESFESE